MNTLNRKMFANGDEARVTEDYFGMPMISNEISENAVPSSEYFGMNSGIYYAPPSNNEDVIQEYLKEKELDNIARREEILGSQDPTKAVNPTELIKYYVSQEYKPSVIIELLQKQFPTITQSDVLDTITSYRESQNIQQGAYSEDNAFEKIKTEDFTNVKGLKPNQIQFKKGEIIDFDVGLASIRNGTARTEEIYALYNTPGVKLGADVAQEIKYFLDKRAIISKDITGDDPGTEKFGTGIASNEFTIDKPFSGQSYFRSGLSGAGELAREGAEKFSDYFIGQDMGDRFRGKFMGGDPDSFFLSGGRDQESIENMARSMNDPDRFSTGMGFINNYVSDKISDLLSNIDTDVSIPNFDALTNKLRQEANLDPIQKKIDDVSATNANTEDKKTFEEQFAIDAAEARKGKFGLENVTLPEIEGIDETRKAIEKSSNLEIDSVLDEEIGKEIAEDITSEDAPKRNFAQFTRSPDFLRFVRNIGKGLTTTGQLGQGIALGAAGAAEEKYAEEVALRSAQAAAAAKTGDLTEKMFMEKFKSKEEFLNKQPEYNAKLSETIFEVETADAVLGVLKEAQRLVDGDDVTGISPFLTEWYNKFLRQFGTDIPLSSREVAKALLEDIKNGEIKTILGESGRTISNLDRDIAGRLIGEINWKADKETVLKKIALATNRASARYSNSYNNYKAALSGYARFGIDAPFRIGSAMTKAVDESGERIRLYIR